MADARKTLEDSVRRSLRTLMTRAVLLNHEVAERSALHLTDLQCVGLLQLHGPMTAGTLAQHTRLTTSAITAVIGRLERIGLATRDHDPTDRRRVIVRLDQTTVDHTISPAYAAKGQRLQEALARSSDEDLATILSFLDALQDATTEPATTKP